MSIETNEFLLEPIEWNYVHSKERRSDGLAPMPIRTGIRSAVLTCKSCSHTWRAETHGGGLTAVFEGVNVICPSCSASAKVPIPET
jgi:hypothetical protein